MSDHRQQHFVPQDGYLSHTKNSDTKHTNGQTFAAPTTDFRLATDDRAPILSSSCNQDSDLPIFGKSSHRNYPPNDPRPSAGSLFVETPINIPADMLLSYAKRDQANTPSIAIGTGAISQHSSSATHNLGIDTKSAHDFGVSGINQEPSPNTGRDPLAVYQASSPRQLSIKNPSFDTRSRFPHSTSPQTANSATLSVSPGSVTPISSRKIASVYPALLSDVAIAFRTLISVQTHTKDSLEYKNSFTGREAVDILCYVNKTADRSLALLLGRALDSQRFFHDVTYDHRLHDSADEIYQFSSNADFDNDRDDAESGTTVTSPTFSEDDEDDRLTSVTASGSPQPRALKMDLNAPKSNALPSGVFTLMADCYSPTCSRDSVCYSTSCPRRLEQQTRLKDQLDSGLKGSEGTTSLSGERTHTFWIESVPKEIADSVSKQEQKRQEIIFELIYTEKDFVEDLEILKKLYLEPLSSANVIQDKSKLDKFIQRVFHNITEIHEANVPLLERLLKRQEENAVVERVGDIFRDLVDRFEPFVEYGGHQPSGKYYLDKSIQKYPELPRWLQQRERMPESRKLPIQSFLARPTTRLARYPLLLDGVIRASPEDHPDRQDLSFAIEKIRAILKRINTKAGLADTRIRLKRLNSELSGNQADLNDLDLRNEKRQLIREGTLKKRSNVDQVELTVFLLDHCLLLTKKSKARDGGGYKIHKRPIPLELLTLAAVDEPILRRSTRRPSSVASSSTLNNTSTSTQQTRANDQNKAGFPLTLTHLGRNGTEMTLYASSQAEYSQWRSKIEQQCQIVTQPKEIFEVVTLTETLFHKTIHVNCSAVFDNGRKIALATDDGIYVGIEGNPESIEKTLDLEKVHRIEILEDYNMVLALHGKNKVLMSYPMDCLKGIEAASAKRNGRKIASHASFFKIGMCMNRILVCVVNSAALYSTIKALEPVSAMVNKKKSLGTMLRGTETMKVYREFYIPAESSSIHFLKTKLCVGCNKGFEVVDLETLNTLGLLDPSDESLNFILKRDSARPISIFRIRNGDFLLCYDEFAFFVNKNGRRSRPDWMVNWEGTPTAFAISFPYIIAFDSKFIEIRDVETGKLEQVIATGPLRCLNTHSNSIHGVTAGRQDYQHVFKLQRNPNYVPKSSN